MSCDSYIRLISFIKKIVLEIYINLDFPSSQQTHLKKDNNRRITFQLAARPRRKCEKQLRHSLTEVLHKMLKELHCTELINSFCNKNIVRHTRHIIVSWPSLQLWPMIHISNLMMMIMRWITNIFTLIKRGKCIRKKTHAKIWSYIWVNWLVAKWHITG